MDLKSETVLYPAAVKVETACTCSQMAGFVGVHQTVLFPRKRRAFWGAKFQTQATCPASGGGDSGALACCLHLCMVKAD